MRLSAIDFTRELSKVSAENFVKDILLRRLKVKDIVVGPGFSFGHKREGNVDLLRSMGKTHDFNTVVAEAARVDDRVVSSSAIRGAGKRRGNPRVEPVFRLRLLYRGRCGGR